MAEYQSTLYNKTHTGSSLHIKMYKGALPPWWKRHRQVEDSMQNSDSPSVSILDDEWKVRFPVLWRKYLEVFDIKAFCSNRFFQLIKCSSVLSVT